jgi:hypothetical protein
MTITRPHVFAYSQVKARFHTGCTDFSKAAARINGNSGQDYRNRRGTRCQRSDAKCAASDSISALLRSASSGSGLAEVPCDRVPLRINCNDQVV